MPAYPEQLPPLLSILAQALGAKTRQQSLLEDFNRNSTQTVNTPASQVPSGLQSPTGANTNFQLPASSSQQPIPTYDPRYQQTIGPLLAQYPQVAEALMGMAKAREPQFAKMGPGETYGSVQVNPQNGQPQFTQQGETDFKVPPIYARDINGNPIVVTNKGVQPSNVVTTQMQNADTKANAPTPAKGAVSFHDDKSGRDVTGIPVYNKTSGKWELQELGGAIPKPAAGGAANNKTGMAAFDPALDASGRLKIMQDAAANPNAQNDMALLFNHIGMTLSAQKGARITNAEIERAIKARSLPGDIQAMYQKVQNGQFLTPEQRAQMVQLGVDNRKIIWEKARSKAKFYGVTSEPGDLSGLPPVENTSSFQLNGKTYNIPSAEVEEFLKDNPSAKRQ